MADVPIARSRNRLYDWLVAVVALLVALAAAEFILRAFAPKQFYIWPPNFHAKFHPTSEVMPGIEGVSVFTTNSMGLRGREPSTTDRTRILAIGGSTTECLYLDDKETWTHLLETSLNGSNERGQVWIGNAGRSGHTTRNHRLQVERLLKQSPEVDQILVLAGINDLTLRLRAHDAHLTLSQREPAYHRKLIRKSFALVPPGADGLATLERLALWQRVRAVIENRARADDFASLETSSGDVYETRRRSRANAVRIIEQLPDLSDALDEFEGNLRAIIATAQSQGVATVLLTQPAMWRDDLPDDLERLLWFGIGGKRRDVDNVPFFGTAALAEGMARYNQRTLDVCATSSARCIDLASRLPRDTSVFYDDVHFNENGARLVAALLAEQLQALTIAGAP